MSKFAVAAVQAGSTLFDTGATLKQALAYIGDARGAVSVTCRPAGGLPRRISEGTGPRDHGRVPLRPGPEGLPTLLRLGDRRSRSRDRCRHLVRAGPKRDGAGLLLADIDLDQLAQAKFDFDADGHYARPDVFTLLVDEEEKLTTYGS